MLLAVLFVAIGAVISPAGVSGVAGAANGPSARSAAKTTGDDLVHQLMAKDKGNACTDASKRGFVGGGASYLASCTGADGDFRFLVIVQVKPGGATVDYPFVQQRINDVCKGAGGAVYSVGVKDRFVAMYLGRGTDTDAKSGAATAYGLWSGLAQQLQGTGGRFVAASSCAGGQVTKKLI
jgi:hypothetical protein